MCCADLAHVLRILYNVIIIIIISYYILHGVHVLLDQFTPNTLSSRSSVMDIQPCCFATASPEFVALWYYQ